MAANIRVDKDEFPDIVIAFLLDKLIRGDEVLAENEDFNDLMELFEKRGLKNFLLHYYMSSNATVRSKYKRLSSSLESGKSESGRITISPSTKEIETDDDGQGKLKGLIKKALKRVVAHKKRTGFPLNEEKVDKIIDKLLKDEGVI